MGSRGGRTGNRSVHPLASSPVIAMTYARNTTVSAMRTRNEIEETLERYGADGFAYATQGNLATVIFADLTPENRSRVNVRILGNTGDRTCQRGSTQPRKSSTSSEKRR